jgi:hypothetical protein
MADSKISALPASTTPLAGTEVLPIVQSSTTKQVTVANLTVGRSVSASAIVAPTVGGGSGSSLGLQANGTTYATILGAGTNNGYVGIGTSSPQQLLQIDGTNSGGPVFNIRLNNTSATTVGTAVGIEAYTAGINSIGNFQFIRTAAAYGASAFSLSVTDGSGLGTVERLRIDSGGIYTMSAYGAGAATFSSSGVISSVSDETWKIKDGVPADADSMLKKLEPGYWFYNDKKKEIFGTDRQLGFYAQNVNAAIGPEAAPEPEDGKPWGYYDRSVLAVVVMSLQKALETIDSLTARVVQLEAK